MDKDSLNIKLSIADRLYPLSINPLEEEGFRKAAKKINDMIQDFESIYELRDKQDALAMCTITLARQIEQSKLNENNEDQSIKNRLIQLCHSLDIIS